MDFSIKVFIVVLPIGQTKAHIRALREKFLIKEILGSNANVSICEI